MAHALALLSQADREQNVGLAENSVLWRTLTSLRVVQTVWSSVTVEMAVVDWRRRREQLMVGVEELRT